jgi:hypothetical protein
MPRRYPFLLPLTLAGCATALPPPAPPAPTPLVPEPRYSQAPWPTMRAGAAWQGGGLEHVLRRDGDTDRPHDPPGRPVPAAAPTKPPAIPSAN